QRVRRRDRVSGPEPAVRQAGLAVRAQVAGGPPPVGGDNPKEGGALLPQYRLQIRTPRVEEVAEGAPVLVCTLLADQKSQPALTRQTHQLATGSPGERFRRAAPTPDLRCIDTDQPHPPTIHQIKRIAIDHLLAADLLADAWHGAMAGQRRRGHQPENKKGAPEERLLRTGQSHRGLPDRYFLVLTAPK